MELRDNAGFTLFYAFGSELCGNDYGTFRRLIKLLVVVHVNTRISSESAIKGETEKSFVHRLEVTTAEIKLFYGYSARKTSERPASVLDFFSLQRSDDGKDLD